MTPEITVALYLFAFGAFGALTQALSPTSAWLPWSIPGPVRLLALAVIAALQTGFESAFNGQPLGMAVLIALATTSAGWIALAIQVVGYYAAELMLAALLLSGLSQTGCGLTKVGAKSPCVGLYCLSIEIIGAPGAALVCYETKAQAMAMVRAMRCTEQPGERRAVCPYGTPLGAMVP